MGQASDPTPLCWCSHWCQCPQWYPPSAHWRVQHVPRCHPPCNLQGFFLAKWAICGSNFGIPWSRILKWYPGIPENPPVGNFRNSWWTMDVNVLQYEKISSSLKISSRSRRCHWAILIPNFWSVAQWSVSTAATARTLVTFGALELTKSSTWKATRMATLVFQDKSIKKATCCN